MEKDIFKEDVEAVNPPQAEEANQSRSTGQAQEEKTKETDQDQHSDKESDPGPNPTEGKDPGPNSAEGNGQGPEGTENDQDSNSEKGNRDFPIEVKMIHVLILTKKRIHI